MSDIEYMRVDDIIDELMNDWTIIERKVLFDTLADFFCPETGEEYPCSCPHDGKYRLVRE